MKKAFFFGVFEDNKRLYTENIFRAPPVYGERTVNNYREWDPTRSKLAAAIKKGIHQIGIRPGDHVLYLGAASGTTASHVSDIVGKDGVVYALDFAPRVVRDLVFVAEARPNMTAILADAHNPLSYVDRVPQVDVIYQDIAQREQLEIFAKNIEIFLKKGGFGVIAVKARSIDVTKNPKQIFKQARHELEKRYKLIDYKELAPFEKDHILFVVKK